MIEHDGLTFDYTHEKVDERMLEYFQELAVESHLKEKIEAMFNGVEYIYILYCYT